MMEVREGRVEAFERLFARHRQGVYRYFLYHVRDADAAAELFQQTFVRLWESRRQYRPGSAFAPWLFTMAANLRRDAARRESVRARHRAAGPDASDAPSAADAQWLVEQAEGTRRALAALERLAEPQREAVVMAKIQGLDYRQIGEALGISADAAKLRVFRGLEKLREELT